MHVCIVCVYARVHASMCICMYVYMYACVHTCLYVYVIFKLGFEQYWRGIALVWRGNCPPSGGNCPRRIVRGENVRSPTALQCIGSIGIGLPLVDKTSGPKSALAQKQRMLMALSGVQLICLEFVVRSENISRGYRWSTSCEHFLSNSFLFMLLDGLGWTTAIPFSFIFQGLVFLQFSWSSIQLQGFPRYTHISTHMFDELHLLPLHARIQYKIITGFQVQRGVGPKYLSDVHVILRPHAASSIRSLRSLNRLDLLVPL